VASEPQGAFAAPNDLKAFLDRLAQSMISQIDSAVIRAIVQRVWNFAKDNLLDKIWDNLIGVGMAAPTTAAPGVAPAAAPPFDASAADAAAAEAYQDLLNLIA
jgi:hypothetical protein